MPENAGAPREPGWWPLAQVQAATPLDHEFVLACLSTLTRHGLAMTATGYGGVGDMSYALSPLGRAMADVMSQAGSWPQDGGAPG
jgi:hypothetical protein